MGKQRTGCSKSTHPHLPKKQNKTKTKQQQVPNKQRSQVFGFSPLSPCQFPPNSLPLQEAMIAGSARGFCTSEKAAEVEQRLGDDPTETLWVRGDWIDSRGFLYRSLIKFSFCGFALLARKTDRCFDGFRVVFLWFLMRFLYFHWFPMTFCCRLSIVESQPKEHRPHVWAKNAQVTKVIHLGPDTLATERQV